MSQYLWPIYKPKQWFVELTMIYYVIDVFPQLFCHVQFPTFYPKSNLHIHWPHIKYKNTCKFFLIFFEEKRINITIHIVYKLSSHG
jgi:hypothetical protein